MQCFQVHRAGSACLKEMGNLSEVSKLAHSACGLFQQHGSPESAVTALDKAAKMLEATQPQQALELFRRAVDIISVKILSFYE